MKCYLCREKISSSSIPQDRLTKLKRNLITLIKASIIRNQDRKINDVKINRVSDSIKTKVQSKSNYFDFYDALTVTGYDKEKRLDEDAGMDLSSLGDAFDVLKKLQKFMDARGPFDVVIDALNIGYFSQGFDPTSVRCFLLMF